MKLHRIEIRNLASLQGDHALDLDADLGSPSLFLIHGPTGAGKSTLMDAVSLALFGTTPRQTGVRASADIADALISRGAGEARVVVTFSTLAAGQRQTFQAGWITRRARQRADGKVQDVRRSLAQRNADGTWHTRVDDHRDKHVQPAFEEVLQGFTVEDFRRSMLLAQGQFDAFLRASEKERANILERLTDTSDYAALGERASRLAAAWRVQIDAAEVARRAAGGVDPELEAQAAEGLPRHEAAVREAEDRHHALSAAARWQDEDRRLVDGLNTATSRHVTVTAARDDAAPALSALTRHEALADVFLTLDALTTARSEVQRLTAEAASAEAQLPSRRATTASLHDAAAAATHAVTRLRAADEALRGPFADAHTDQRALDAAVAEHDAASLASTQASARREAATRRAAEASAARDTQVDAQQRAADDLAAHPDDAALHDARGTIDRLGAVAAASAQTAQRRTAAHTQAAQALHRDQDRLAADLTTLQQQRATALQAPQAALVTAQTALTHALARAPSAATTVVDARAAWQSAAEVGRTRAQAAALAATALTDLAAAVAAHVAADEHARHTTDRLASAQATADAARPATVTTRAAADALADSLAALSLRTTLVQYRAALVDGEPCPLCGAEDHPLVADAARAAADAAERAILDRLRDQARQAEADARTAASTAATADADLASAVTAHQQATETARQRRAAREEVGRTAVVALDAADLPHHPPSDEVGATVPVRASTPHLPLFAARPVAADREPTLPAAVASAAAAEHAAAARRADAERATLDAAVDAARAAEEHLRGLTERIDAQARALDQTASALTARTQALRDEAEALSVLHDEAAATRSALRDTIATHAEPVGDGPAAWIEAVHAAAERHATRTRAHVAAERACAEADAAVGRAAEALTAAQAAADEAESRQRGRADAVTEARAASQRAAEALQAAWTSHRPALGVDAPEHPTPAALAERLRVATAAATQATVTATDAAQALAAAEATAATLRNEADQAATRADAAHTSLHAALTAQALPDEAALTALRLTTADRARLTELRTRLDRDHTAATADLHTRAEMLAGHRAAPPPHATEPADALSDGLRAAEQARVEATAAREDARLTLREAEGARARRAAAEAHLARLQADARVWLHLSDLIGRNKGESFKVYAQALNLGGVLARANVHLAALNPRYRLVSHVDADGHPTLDLRVADAWQVGEPRELRTLSGGETFLVSLALALGLSDSRTVRLPLETLLLDEGFGTLDADTLDVALAALQQLQATGRQVGVISHVTTLQERIPARVQVVPQGAGRSALRIHGRPPTT